MTPDAAVKVLSRRLSFRWQSDLLTDWFIAGRIPDAVDVPTGLGKTTVITLWLAARATGAKLPRRLVYVVDRRAVVDQATKEAEGLRNRIGDGEGQVDPKMAEVRQALGLKPKQWLRVSTLRGQLADNRAWLEDPSAPAIIVGTVDMIGSRLLFSGYGVSRRMRPVHAGLLGADALIVLDEAHLAPPFEGLVRQVIVQRTARGGGDGVGIIPALHLMSLSATGRDEGSGEVFRLTEAHQADPPVRKRLDAVKRLRVLPTVSQKDLADILARRAVQLGGKGGAVLVFCDSRLIAQKVAQILSNPPHKCANIALLVGERRALERQRLTTTPVFQRFMPRSAESAPSDGPAFLIATSAGEVGVDLDADHMVCDLVSWERMVQRLGRVNRRAEPGESLIEVISARFDPKDEEADTRIEDKDVDPRLAALTRAVSALPTLPDAPGLHDASPGAILELRTRAAADPTLSAVLTAATSDEPLRPALTPAVVESWAMTSLDHHPGRPNVAPWIRGWVDDTPQARVLWRRLFPLPVDFKPAEDVRAVVDKATRRLLDGYFDAAPPHLTETLEAPTFRVVDTLKKRADAWLKPRPRRTGEPPLPAQHPPVVVVLDSAGEVEDLFWAERLTKESDAKALIRLFTGRTLVIDARLGGLDEEGLLDSKADDPPPTWDAATPVAEAERGWSVSRLQALGRRLWEKPANAPPEKGWVREYGWSPFDAEDDDGASRELRVERLKAVPSAGDASRATPQGLSEHLDWTGDDVGGIADRLGLDARMKQVLVVAARAHDLGKDRANWQNAMGARREGRPWAKTSGLTADTALLDGYRHEFGSLRDGEDHVRREIDAPELQELALHLIAAHHGHARPTIKAHDPDEAPFKSEARARAVALRYARLQKQWGPWGLAWWEALLRAADWSASRRIAETEREDA